MSWNPYREGVPPSEGTGRRKASFTCRSPAKRPGSGWRWGTVPVPVGGKCPATVPLLSRFCPALSRWSGTAASLIWRGFSGFCPAVPVSRVSRVSRSLRQGGGGGPLQLFPFRKRLPRRFRGLSPPARPNTHARQERTLTGPPTGQKTAPAEVAGAGWWFVAVVGLQVPLRLIGSDCRCRRH